MSKIELDDMILEHPKFIRAVKLAGSDAVFLWLGLRAYCARMLTDGFIPADMVEEVRGPRDSSARASALSALKEAKLVDDSDGGVVLHDYLDWAQSRAQILAWRKANAERKARSRANSERKTGSGTNVTRESRCDNANVTVGVTCESHRSHGWSHAGVLEPSPSPSPSPSPFTLPIGRDPPITPLSAAECESGQSDRRSDTEPAPTVSEPFRLTADEHLGHAKPPEDQPEPKARQRGIQTAKRAKEQKPPKPVETDPPSTEYRELVDCYFAAFERRRGDKPGFGAREGKSVKSLLAFLDGDLARAKGVIENAYNDGWAGDKFTINDIARDPSRFIGSRCTVQPRIENRPPPPDGRAGWVWETDREPHAWRFSTVVQKRHDEQRANST